MKTTVITCDRCGGTKSGPGPRLLPFAWTIQVFIDRRMDAAGSMDDVWDSVDLCPKCMWEQLELLMDGKSNVVGHHKYGQDFIEANKKK